jgi:hypothetical protein
LPGSSPVFMRCGFSRLSTQWAHHLTPLLNFGTAFADFTIFAGRWFHFHYEPLIVKVLWAADLPALLLAVLPALLVSPVVSLVHLGTFERSYVAAGEFLVAGSLQWLAGKTPRGAEPSRHRSSEQSQC